LGTNYPSAARKKVGNERWKKNALDNMRRLTNFDHLYVDGGNARKIDFPLDPECDAGSQ
jgi:polyphosphate glucokinase